MPKQLHLSVVIDLQDNEWEAAKQMTLIHPAWMSFLEALGSTELHYDAKMDCCEVRARRADAGKPRARKPRLVPPPQDAA